MKSINSEAGVLSKTPRTNVRSKNCRYIPKSKEACRGNSSTKNAMSSKGKRTITSRYHKALMKAVSVRKRVLSRDLSLSEWQALKIAVRKQCSRICYDSVSVQLRSVLRRITQLENCNPQGAMQLSDSISMFQVQVSALRRQVFEMLDEKSDVSASCSHFRRRKVVRLLVNSLSPRSGSIEVPGLGFIPFQIVSRKDIECCAQCLSSREDALFSWTGGSIESFSSLAKSYPELKGFSHMNTSPLALQSVWSEVLSLKFES